MPKELKDGLLSEIKPITEGMKNLKNASTFPQFQSLIAYEDNGEEEDAFIWDIAEQYLRKFASLSGADTTFGLWDKDGKFYIGNKETYIKETNIIVGDKEYVGTPRLLDFIVATTPDDTIFTNEDYDNNAEIMHSTNALRRNNDESETKPKANRSWKWKHILKPFWDKDRYTGNTFGSNHQFTMWPYCTCRMTRYTDGK